MARIIAVANQKGGVGKTTTVINLAVALAHKKQKVLVIDLDPQGSLTVGLGLEADELERTIYTVLVEPEIPINRIIQPIRPFLDLVPATSNLANAEVDLVAEIKRELILQNILKPLDTWYDFILIDCPPNLNLLTTNALCACTELLIPVQCEYFALRSLEALLELVKKVKTRLNSQLELSGFLATMYATGTVHAREVLEEIQSAFGEKVFEVVVYKSIRFAESSVANQSIIEYEHTHRGAEAYIKLAEIIMAQQQK